MLVVIARDNVLRKIPPTPVRSASISLSISHHTSSRLHLKCARTRVCVLCEVSGDGNKSQALSSALLSTSLDLIIAVIRRRRHVTRALLFYPSFEFSFNYFVFAPPAKTTPSVFFPTVQASHTISRGRDTDTKRRVDCSNRATAA